ncbi:MAG: PEP-utilizing enzyme [bacterium]
MPDAAAVGPVPQTIPLPPDFPIQWPDPAMAMANWQQDRMHAPEPLTPMSEWLARTFAKGFSAGLAAYKLPLAVETARLNCYFFMAIGPNVPPEMMPEAGAAAEPHVIAGVANFWDRWQNEWLPEIKGLWADWAENDLAAATDAQLALYVDQLVEIYRRIWQIHFELLVPAFVGISSFQDLFTGLFPDKEPLEAYRLLQGFDNKSLEADRNLWAIGNRVRTDPTLRHLVEATHANDLPQALEASEAGQAVLADLQGWLAVYGKRSDTVQELAYTSWIEDPTPAFNSLKSSLEQSEAPEAAHARLAQERQRLVDSAREAIKNHPEELRGQFEVFLAAGQHGSQAQEDHNHWIDQRSLHEVRHLCLEIGNRLVKRGLLKQPADVLLLEMDEALGALAGSPTNLAQLVDERTVEMDRWRSIQPPLFVGTDYGPPPDDPVSRAIMRFFGGPPPASRAANEIRGNAGASGKAKGTARVILTIADAGRLQEGEILVTPTTSPPWTPFFAIAGGIVTETGGPLSHCAIVAREYGLPAVVGAFGATTAIKDGQTIEIDGDDGAVRILS